MFYDGCCEERERKRRSMNIYDQQMLDVLDALILERQHNPKSERLRSSLRHQERKDRSGKPKKKTDQSETGCLDTESSFIRSRLGKLEHCSTADKSTCRH